MAAESHAKLIFKSAKATSFLKFCESLDPSISVTQLRNTIKRFRHRGLAAEISSNNQKNIRTMHEIIHKLCPPSCFSAIFPSTVIATQETDELFRKPFDMIEYNLPEKVHSELLASFNEIYSTGKFPPSWNDFLISFIPYGNGKVRPITLAPSFLKLLERMIHTPLSCWLENHQLLPSNQFGFRKMKSYAENLKILTTSIYEGFAKKLYAAVL